MSRATIRLAAVALTAGLVGVSVARAQVFIPGNVVVERVGDGAAPLASAATAAFLEQYNPTTAGQASPVTSTPLPTTVGTSGNPLAMTDSGSATSNGQLTLALNGSALVVTGYNAALATASVAGSAPGTINRSIGLVSTPTAVNSTNGFSDGPSNNFRSVASVDGSSFYASIAGIATNGIQFKTATGTVTTTTVVLNGNERVVRILTGSNGNSLFVSSASGTGPGVGVALVGAAGALPTTLVTGAVLPGTATSGTGTPSPYGFELFHNALNSNDYLGTGFNLMYVADDRPTATGGGIQRWEYNGTAWILDATLATTIGGARGLTGSISGGLVTLFATTTETSANTLIEFTDTPTGSVTGGGTGGAFSAVTVLATAATNEAFRGVDFAPFSAVPEPGSLALLGLAGLGIARRLRRQ